MAAVTVLMKDKAIMAAALLGTKDIEDALEFDDVARAENEQAIKIAEMMMKECLRNYSAKYNAAREDRLKKRAECWIGVEIWTFIFGKSDSTPIFYCKSNVFWPILQIHPIGQILY